MKPILVIAPHKNIKDKAMELVESYDDVEVELALLDEAIEVAKKAEKQGVEAIVSRGGTARIIEKAVPSIPVIDIKVSPYDILHAIYSAKKYGKNICILGFRSIIGGVRFLDSILDINLRTFNIDDEESGEECIRELVNAGEKIDALLGGTLAENLALKHDIPTVPLDTGIDTINISIEEARRIVEVTRKEKEKTEQFKAILHYINEGIISIDNNKRVTTFNSAAAILSKVPYEDAIGRPVDEVLKNTRLDKVLEQNTPELGEIFEIGEYKVLTNRVPIILNDKTVGAVATFQDITKIQEYEQRIRAKLLSKGFVAKYGISDIVGESKTFVDTKSKAKRYASTDSTVLIVGESGTGKELFVQSIHLESKRRKGPFVAVNCASIPQNLLESELFGYEEGAFTGAKKSGKMGLFTEAHNGTIFLDEIGEISTELQARLLRVLQEREVRPVGSNRVIPIDVRIIAATNKNLLDEVKKGNFRSDLYYRLNILKLLVPSLRKRKDDIKLLSRHFVDKISSKYNKKVDISDDALKKLEEYNWPGNIRELENIIERLVVLNDSRITGKEVSEFLDEQIKESNYKETDNGISTMDTLEEVKEKHICKVLDECEGNQTLAAKRLGISRTHLWRIVNDYKEKVNH